jgi:hypothetical protein
VLSQTLVEEVDVELLQADQVDLEELVLLNQAKLLEYGLYKINMLLEKQEIGLHKILKFKHIYTICIYNVQVKL